MIVNSGIQQAGVGVRDVGEAFSWYCQKLGFDIPVIDDTGVADRMLPYTGGKPRGRHAVLAINLGGGGGLEIWQYTTRDPEPPGFAPQAGDLGIYTVKLGAPDIEKAFKELTARGVETLGGPAEGPCGVRSFHIKDPYGNLFRVEENSAVFAKTPAVNTGVRGVVIGVSDLDASVAFYREFLGYDRVLSDEKGVFSDIIALPGGDGTFRRALLSAERPRAGAFSRLLGPSYIELLQVLDRQPRKIFENRLWGDLGFIHLCFDVRGMDELKALCAEKGRPFTADSCPEEGAAFDMGMASGRFAYIEDPDGALIEYVETYKIPLLKRPPLSLKLRGRPPDKPLPGCLLKALRLGRRKQRLRE